MIEFIAAGGVAVVGSALSYLYITSGSESEPDEAGSGATPQISTEPVEDPVVEDVFDDEELEESGIESGPVGEYYVENDNVDEDAESLGEVTETDESEEVNVNEDVEDQADPVPDYVNEMSGLTDITGIGPTKAQKLGVAGFSNPEDVFFASDDNLTDVTGIGTGVVSQIRDDIGYLDEPEIEA